MLSQFRPTSCWTNAYKNVKMVMSSGCLNSVCIKCVHVHQGSNFSFMSVNSPEVSLSTMFHAQIKAVKRTIPFVLWKNDWFHICLRRKCCGDALQHLKNGEKYDFQLVMNPLSLHPGLVSELSSSSKEIYQPKSCFLNYDYISCSWSADSAINGRSALHLYFLRCTPPQYTDLYGW